MKSAWMRRPKIALRALLTIALFFALAKPAISLELKRPIRAFHFVLLGLSPDDAKRLVDKAAAERLNVLIVNVLWGASVQLRSFPWAVQTHPWRREDLTDFVRYARTKQIEVVPQMDLLSHQRVLLGKYRPDLMFNKSTYDPHKREVYELVLPMLDELVDLIQPKAFHIGHDEVVGWEKGHFGNFIGREEHALPGDLYLKDVMILHEHLREKGIETWMWGDMLIAPEEFPAMKSAQLHGHLLGYGKQLRDKLPRDIVICDWHYLDEQTDFPSLAAFRTEGFRVLGATWEKARTVRNFSHYAAKRSADGMIATSWFYVQNKDLGVVDRIIRESGEAFGRDFPDAK